MAMRHVSGQKGTVSDGGIRITIRRSPTMRIGRATNYKLYGIGAEGFKGTGIDPDLNQHNPHSGRLSLLIIQLEMHHADGSDRRRLPKRDKRRLECGRIALSPSPIRLLILYFVPVLTHLLQAVLLR